MTTIISDEGYPLISIGTSTDDTIRELRAARRAAVEVFIDSHYDIACDGAEEFEWLVTHPESARTLIESLLTVNPQIANGLLLDAVSPVAANERIAVLEEALRHRREYDDKGWSHVECGAEESIRERLALLDAVSPVAVTTTKPALWNDPAPTTPEGQRLLALFVEGKLAGNHAAGIRDFGQRIAQVEAEASEAPASLDAALVDPEAWETVARRLDENIAVGPRPTQYRRAWAEAHRYAAAAIRARLTLPGGQS